MEAISPHSPVTPPPQVRESAKTAGEQQLTEQERKQVESLKRRDREVRQHEQAHKAAAGAHGGAPVYEYQRGPDGKRYAVSGHVEIDTSEVEGDPEATIRKMEAISRAARAPAEPSSQDRQVAAQAQQKAREARTELADEQRIDVYA
jgi:hypothetical protein